LKKGSVEKHADAVHWQGYQRNMKDCEELVKGVRDYFTFL